MLTKPDKWYVRNGDIRILVLAYDFLDAICQALSYMRFKDASDVPESMFEWDCFIVHPLGFRSPFGLDGYDEETWNDSLGFEVMYDEALDYFDETCRKFDPFCENETHRAHDKFYEDLGEENNDFDY